MKRRGVVRRMLCVIGALCAATPSPGWSPPIVREPVAAGAQESPRRHERLSPFDEVVWDELDGVMLPMVRVEGAPELRGAAPDARWLVLSIDGVPIDAILKSIDERWGARVRPDERKAEIHKRFEEDLVEVMAGLPTPLTRAMGKTARLQLVCLEMGEEGRVVVEAAEMSHAKRQKLRKAAEERKKDQRIPAPSSDVALSADEACAALDTFQATVEKHSAYAAIGAVRTEAGISEMGKYLGFVRRKARESGGMQASGVGRAMKWVLAATGDGHASARAPDEVTAARPAVYLPFLPTSVGEAGAGVMEPALGLPVGRVAAVAADRRSLIGGPEAPIISTISGRNVELWLMVSEKAGGVAYASPQLRRERACRALRHFAAADAQARSLEVQDLPAIDQSVRCEFVRSDGTGTTVVRDVMLSREEPKYGEWPRTQSAIPDGGIGYLRLPQMNESAVKDIHEWMARFRPAAAEGGTKALIIDVRGNGGGSRDALYALVPYLMKPGDKPVIFNAARPLLVDGRVPDEVEALLADRGLFEAGSDRWRDEEKRAIAEFAATFKPERALPEERFGAWRYAVASPNEPGEGATSSPSTSVYHYNRPVVVLLDSVCFSATDMFLSAMKAIGAGGAGGGADITLIGQPSAGGSGGARTFVLEAPGAAKGKFSVRLSSMVSFQSDGMMFDGHGVQPDVPVSTVPTDFILKEVGGTDSILDAAIARLNKADK